MRKSALLFSILAAMVVTLISVKEVKAVNRIQDATPTIIVNSVVTPTITETPEPTPTAVKGNITEPQNPDLSYRLESVLEKQGVGRWNFFNSLRLVERFAISRGVGANTIVLLLLLPLMATLISVLHYVVGLSGYGIFIPTLVAVTFLATGILGGLVLFALILAISILSNLILKKFKIHFWPARAINLMFISIGTVGLMVGSSFIKLVDLTKISIFPILVMVMLAEEFVRTQLIKSKSEAKKLTIGTLILAITGAVMMNFRWIQETVLLYPELTIVAVLVVNIMVGNYDGIRISEIRRFKNAIRSK
ncbi:MAG TPA: 7TM domain-containing protein [Patescibacteria group bacterium]